MKNNFYIYLMAIFSALFLFSCGDENVKIPEEVYPNQPLNLSLNNISDNTKMYLKSDSQSSIGKYPIGNDVTLIYLDSNNVSIGKYFTHLDPTLTSQNLTLTVPINTKKIAAYVNKSTLPSEIVSVDTNGKSLDEINQTMLSLPLQEDPIETISLYGTSEPFELPRDCCVSVTVGPVPARHEITNVIVNLSDLSNQEWIKIKDISLNSIYVSNIYDNVSFDKTINDNNLITIYDIIGKDGDLIELNGFDYRYEYVNNIGVESSNKKHYYPKNEVWGFQILPTKDVMPKFIFKFKFEYQNGTSEF
jgi:hypothetical protein